MIASLVITLAADRAALVVGIVSPISADRTQD
jgi:hypothetical protein